MSYGLYIHLPFCKSKCPYCSFASITNGEEIVDYYCDTVSREIELRRQGPFDQEPRTIYIGGGTPSIVSRSRRDNFKSIWLNVKLNSCLNLCKDVFFNKSRTDNIIDIKLYYIKRWHFPQDIH